jgi:hypothetical protein
VVVKHKTVDSGQWTMDSFGISFRNLLKHINEVDTITVHCQLSTGISNSKGLLQNATAPRFEL